VRLESGQLQSHLRAKRNFLKQINLILSVQSWAKKYSAFAVGQIIFTSSPVPRSSRGAFRDRHGRRARDAMDASGAADESACLADGEVVWS
jgi:hypothetical protein